jgi:hypothetical protein
MKWAALLLLGLAADYMFIPALGAIIWKVTQ